MTFLGNIVYLRPCSVLWTTRAQINNIPEKSHVIPLVAISRCSRPYQNVEENLNPP